MRTLSIALAVAIITSLVPSTVIAQEVQVPYEQDFIITAYYSPLPNQCCYVLGGEKADKVLNGNGTNGASGKEVYQGMIAAPKSYAFGTRIELPGIGIGTVHDRGGAIVEQENAHRLDLWAGHGEEGLARALAFGVQRVRGKVYPNGSDKPAERMVLKDLPAPVDRLKQYFVADAGLLDLHAKAGDYGLSVVMLQQHLKDAGYFDHAVTGSFGEVTQASLSQFTEDMSLEEPSDQLTEKTAAYLAAAAEVARNPMIPIVNPESAPSAIKKAQRLLRYFGFYRGRTNGVYDDRLFNAILAFQQSEQLVGQSDSPGAGRIGPITKSKLALEWKKKMIAQRAENFLLLRHVNVVLEQKGLLLSRFLKKGSNGSDVTLLQQLLAERGYFPTEKINGNFGDLTASSVAKYQVDAGLVKSLTDPSAGTVGPFTMRKLRQDTVLEKFRMVRGFGLDML